MIIHHRPGSKAFDHQPAALAWLKLGAGWSQTPPRQTHLPVVVHVTELVGEPLHVVWLQTVGVVDDVVVSGGDAPSTDSLAHDVEVIPGTQEP